jgi:hypothetical protein
LTTRKKLLSLSATAVLSLSLAGQSFAATTAFTDLDQVAAKNKIISLQSQGFVSGVRSDLFQPNAALTAGQGIQMIVKALGLNIDTIRFVKAPQATDYFAKAKNDVWYSQSLIIAANNGLDLPANLDPDEKWTKESFTRELVYALEGHNIFHLMKLPPIEIKDQDAITIDKLGPVQLAIYKGITSLDPDGNFHPQADITRAQAAEMIYNALEYIHPAPSTGDTPRLGSSQPMLPADSTGDASRVGSSQPMKPADGDTPRLGSSQPMIPVDSQQ